MSFGFVFQPSYWEAVQDLPDQDRLAILDAIINYGLFGEIVELPAHLRGFMSLIKPTLDASRNRYNAAVANGKKGGRPRKNQNENQNENQMQNLNINTNIDMNRNIHTDKNEEAADKPPHSPRFVPPSVDDVRQYCTERGNGIDAQHFVDFYEARGWLIGRNKMKSWKAAVRTWEQRDNAASGTEPPKRELFDAEKYQRDLYGGDGL